MTFSDLTVFSLGVGMQFVKKEKTSMFEAICKMLVGKCPRLKKLCVSFDGLHSEEWIDFSQFWDGNWPQLEKLTVEFDGPIKVLNEGEDLSTKLTNFFRRMPKLECLHLGLEHVPNISSQEILPALTSLVFPERLSPSLFVSRKMARQLQYFGALELGEVESGKFPFRLFQHMTSLRYIAIICPKEKHLIPLWESAPQLERINFLFLDNDDNTLDPTVCNNLFIPYNLSLIYHYCHYT